MKKRVFVVFAIIFVIFTSFSCAKKTRADGLPDEITIGFLRVPNDEAIAKQKGYIDDFFAQKNIAVRYIIVDSGVEANKAFASHSLDFASMGNTNGIVALSKKLDTELVWIHEVLGSIEGLAVRKNKGIESVADLKGKKIATTFSSTSHYILLNVLKAAGIERDVQVIDMLTVDIVAAWERGDIDAAYTWEPSLSRLVKSGGKILVNSEDMAQKGFITANVGLARKSFARQYPELITGLLSALGKGATLFKESREEAILAASQELELPKATVESQMNGSIWLGFENQIDSKYMGTNALPGNFVAVMKDTADFLKTQGSIDVAPSFDEFAEFINSSYVENAIVQQGSR